jgi:hypothetical protein
MKGKMVMNSTFFKNILMAVKYKHIQGKFNYSDDSEM